MIFENFIKENKSAILFSILIMLVGSIAYVTTDQAMGGASGSGNLDNNIFESIKFKVVIGPDGVINLLANTKNNILATLDTTEGSSILEEDSIVIGNEAAARLKKAGIFSESGDLISSYFGISTTVEGILEKQDNIIDYLTFLSVSAFENADGETGKVFSKVTMEGSAKVFFTLLENDAIISKFQLAEGDISGYEIHNLDGEEYYPLIVGSEEAKVMREEKLFKSTGDPIREFFGKNFVVVGVLEETNTILDYLHFIPLGEDELVEEKEEIEG